MFIFLALISFSTASLLQHSQVYKVKDLINNMLRTESESIWSILVYTPDYERAERLLRNGVLAIEPEHIMEAVYGYREEQLDWMLEHSQIADSQIDGIPIFDLVLHEHFLNSMALDITSIAYSYYTRNFVRNFIAKGASIKEKHVNAAIVAEDIAVFSCMLQSGFKPGRDLLIQAMRYSSSFGIQLLAISLRFYEGLTTDHEEDTPLIIFAIINAPRVCQAVSSLIAYGASPNCFCENGRHALEYAYSFGMMDVLLRLSVSGAHLDEEARLALIFEHDQDSLDIIDDLKAFKFLVLASKSRRSTLRLLPDDIFTEILNVILSMCQHSLTKFNDCVYQIK